MIGKTRIVIDKARIKSSYPRFIENYISDLDLVWSQQAWFSCLCFVSVLDYSILMLDKPRVNSGM